MHPHLSHTSYFEKIFLDNPNTWLTSEKVKSKLRGYGVDLGDNFSSLFLEFRDNFLSPENDYKICKFRMTELTTKFLYSYTNNKNIQLKHDLQLDKEIRKKQTRKIIRA